MIRVVLVDDENLIRAALATMLGLEDDIDIVGQAETGEAALTDVLGWAPDVAVLDLQLGGIDGIETAQRMAKLVPQCASIIVTSHGRPGYLKKALTAGVRGFLPKTTSAATLAAVVRTVHTGGRYVDPTMAAEAIGAGDSPLTPREADVLEYAADGASIAEIAQRAHLSPGTTRNYLSAAASKLGAANRHEACAVARRHGWI
jgi:two-component system response regulator DesR